METISNIASWLITPNLPTVSKFQSVICTWIFFVFLQGYAHARKPVGVGLLESMSCLSNSRQHLHASDSLCASVDV